MKKKKNVNSTIYHSVILLYCTRGLKVQSPTTTNTYIYTPLIYLSAAPYMTRV